MFTSQEIIGDIVYISFSDPERYLDIGIEPESSHFKVLGYDNLGIWVEHPSLLVVKDSSSKSNKEINVQSNFLITWDNIKTIMHYPEREGFDFPSEFDKKYGFKTKK